MGISGSSGRVQFRRTVTRPSSPNVVFVICKLVGLGGAEGSEDTVAIWKYIISLLLYICRHLERKTKKRPLGLVCDKSWVKVVILYNFTLNLLQASTSFNTWGLAVQFKRGTSLTLCKVISPPLTSCREMLWQVSCHVYDSIQQDRKHRSWG